MIAKISRDMQVLHNKLHHYSIPHDCKEFEKYIRRCFLMELAQSEPSLYSHYYGCNN